MAEEQRFSFSMTFKNIKDNKMTIMIIIGVFLILGLYVAYPVLMFAAGERVSQDLGFIMGRIQHNTSLSKSNESTAFLIKEIPLSFNFTVDVTPEPCMEDNVLTLGENVIFSVCKDKFDNIIFDIRKFTGTVKTGINPSIVGINLSMIQWNILKQSVNIIDKMANDLSNHQV